MLFGVTYFQTGIEKTINTKWFWKLLIIKCLSFIRRRIGRDEKSNLSVEGEKINLNLWSISGSVSPRESWHVSYTHTPPLLSIQQCQNCWNTGQCMHRTIQRTMSFTMKVSNLWNMTNPQNFVQKNWALCGYWTNFIIPMDFTMKVSKMWSKMINGTLWKA